MINDWLCARQTKKEGAGGEEKQGGREGEKMRMPQERS